MDALMAALIAALAAMVPDRAALVVATAARPGRTIAAALLIATVMAAVSTYLGIAIAPRLAPAARQLMLAIALAFVGIEFLIRRLPMTSGGRVAPAIIGSGLWFVVLALAMRSGLPWLAVPGAIIGAMVPLVAAGMGRESWCRLPLIGIRRAVGALFTSVAAVLACAAIGIV